MADYNGHYEYDTKDFELVKMSFSQDEVNFCY